MAPPPPTAARLSSVSTTTLSQILELTRSTQLSIPSPSLPGSISKNLLLLSKGIESLDESGYESDEVLRGLKGQYERLVGLTEGLGVHVEGRKSKGKTGKLVDTGEDDVLVDDESGVQLQPFDSSRPPQIAISFPEEDDKRDLEQMEEDEETMRRANSEVMQMQQRMLNDQDDTLTSLSSAISRQHELSLHISSELELHSSLLDETDEALDRTENGLRRAGGRLEEFGRKAKNTGSTGLIGVLIILLVILIVLFKL